MSPLDNGAQGHAALFIGCSAIDRAAIAFDDGDETIAAAIGGRQGGKAAIAGKAQRSLRIDTVAAAKGNAAIEQANILAAHRFQLDGAGQCAGPPIARTAAARYPDPIQPAGGIGRKCHPAAERIGLRHAIQHQQRA